MPEKSTIKSPDTTPKVVKNTQTGVEAENSPSLRWYHITATVAVLILVIIALVRIFSHFDFTLFGSQYTIKYTIGCTTSISGEVERSYGSYRYSGIENGALIGADGFTEEKGDAYIEIIELGTSRVKIKTRDFATNEWSEKEIRYGAENTQQIDDTSDCVNGIVYTINR